MQQKVTAQHEDFPTVVVQYDKDTMTVGVALEERTPLPGYPSTHPLEMLYGDAPTLTEIGRLFSGMRGCGVVDFTIGKPDFKTNDQEAQWYADLGRTVLAAVGESRPDCDSWWTWLDRPAVNRLIRLLRTARDTAFGADA